MYLWTTLLSPNRVGHGGRSHRRTWLTTRRWLQAHCPRSRISCRNHHQAHLWQVNCDVGGFGEACFLSLFSLEWWSGNQSKPNRETWSLNSPQSVCLVYVAEEPRGAIGPLASRAHPASQPAQQLARISREVIGRSIVLAFSSYQPFPT